MPFAVVVANSLWQVAAFVASNDWTSRGNRVDMWDRSFDGYRRRVDAWEYRSKRRDVPSDAAQLLALAQDIELEERIILDRTDNGAY